MADDDSERVWLPTEVVHRYLAGDRDFRRITIEGSEAEADLGFRGANLAEADFSDSWIDGIDFTGARLVGARFASAHVKLCTFNGADLQNADFSNAAVDAASFQAAECEGATFEGAGAYGYLFKLGEHP